MARMKAIWGRSSNSKNCKI